MTLLVLLFCKIEDPPPPNPPCLPNLFMEKGSLVGLDEVELLLRDDNPPPKPPPPNRDRIMEDGCRFDGGLLEVRDPPGACC